MMRRLLITLTLVALVAPTLGAERQRRDDRETQTERINKTLAIGADGELDVSNIAGDIRVTRSSGANAIIEVVKTARAATADEARAMLALVTVDIAERGTRAEVRARYPDSDAMRSRGRQNINVDVAYTIAAPANTRLIAKSISGNVSVRDIAGSLTLETISGNVQLANAGRVASAKSISGNVELADTRIEGALEASTISGEVRMRKVSARSLTMSSVSGNLLLQDIDAERVNGQSISGEVTFSGDLAPNGRYDLTAHSGNIRIAVGTATGFQVEASSFSGSISSDLPLTLQGGQGGRRQRSLRGTYGNGSAVLALTAFSGNITITKR